MPRGNYGGIRLRNNDMPLIRAASFFLEIGLLFVDGVSNTKYGWSNERRIMLAIGVLQVLGSINFCICITLFADPIKQRRIFVKFFITSQQLTYNLFCNSTFIN